MGNNLYAFMGLAAFLVICVIHSCNRKIRAKNYNEEFFDIVLMELMVYCVVDGLWGLFESKTINLGVIGFYIISMLFHFCASMSAFLWLRFSQRYLNIFKRNIRWVFEVIPVGSAFALLVMQLFNGWVFRIDSNVNYITGEYRFILFYIQLFYFVYGLIWAMYMFFRNRKSEDKSKYIVAMEFMLVPAVTATLQLLFPDKPYGSVGYLIATVVAFNGSIVLNEEKRLKGETENKSRESTEIFKALKAMAFQMVSLHLIDLRYDKQIVVKSTEKVDSFIDPNDDVRTQLQKVMMGTTDPKYTKDVCEFVDIYTLPERMRGKNSIDIEFLGKNVGWCVSSFIKVEEDEDGNVIKVIHVVQDINDRKNRELYFNEMMSRAYKDENTIYAELLKMQLNGLIATDDDEKIIYANDMAQEMFEHIKDYHVGMKYEELIDHAVYLDVDKATSDFKRLMSEGEPISYCVKMEKEDGLEKYYKADARRISRADGGEIVITCFTDITESKNMEDMLRILSETDPLTGIDNRRSGKSKIEMLLADDTDGVFCHIDIDKFKSINDNYGHQVGDKALVEVAKALKASFRANDIVMRIGGDEFAIFAKDITSKKKAEERIRNLFRRINNIEIEEMGENKISISLGATLVHVDYGDTFESMYHRADSVMYISKVSEGNSFEWDSENVILLSH